MKIIKISLLMFVSFFLLLTCTNEDISIQYPNYSITDKLDYNQFVHPPKEFRSFPFYSINDSLSEKEISDQIAEFKKAGFGGFYLHSRLGLITDFLGSEWWKVMDSAVSSAKENGLQAMFYDEDKWPSGYAGGIIPKMNNDFRAKCLVRLDKNTAIPDGSKIIFSDSTFTYIEYTSSFGYDIFNGTCYVDLFNPEAVKSFIEIAYKPYFDRYKKSDTRYTPAIFTDEPHVHARYFDKNTPNKGVLSWSPWFVTKFKERYGYSLLEHLPELFNETGEWRKIRLHYYQLKALLFEESFTKQISSACSENGYVFTGHFLGEEVLEKVRDRIANSMLHYRSMQQPGIDNLGLNVDGQLITAKSLTSVANQFNKPKRLSELFGISGQNMNFENRKWIAGWHSIMGINHYCPHLTAYSILGARKRDYPPTFSYHQPYWEYNKIIEDYMARIAWVTSYGKYDAQFLVLSPLESEFIKGKNDGEFSDSFIKILENMQVNHYDFDIGDEQILADTAHVLNGNLIVGSMKYRNIILPDMISMRRSTFEIIRKLQLNGGLIFAAGRVPEFFDGVRDSVLFAELNQIVINTGVPELKEITEKIKPNVILAGIDSHNILTQKKRTQEGELIQFFNRSHTQKQRVRYFNDEIMESCFLWDPSTFTCSRIEKNIDGSFIFDIDASSVKWITIGKMNKKILAEKWIQDSTHVDTCFIFSGNWEGNALNENAITLDFARYSVDMGKTFSKPEPVIGIFNRLSGMKYNGNLILDYIFQTEKLPSHCSVAVEKPFYSNPMKINGKKYQFIETGFFTDHNIKKSDITKFLKKGSNSILIEMEFKAPLPLSQIPKERYGTEIESIYLCGDFAVDGINHTEKWDSQRNNSGNFNRLPVHQFSGFKITQPKNEFTGDLTVEGYPFFSGAFALKQRFEINEINPNYDYFLEIPVIESVTTIVKVNSNIADTLVWSPYKSKITTMLKPGTNEIELIMINSLRNLLGPHHHKSGELIKAGPNSFTGAGGFPDGRGEPDWFNLRLNNKPMAIWTDVYHHIPFGLMEKPFISSNFKKNE